MNTYKIAYMNRVMAMQSGLPDAVEAESYVTRGRFIDFSANGVVVLRLQGSLVASISLVPASSA